MPQLRLGLLSRKFALRFCFGNFAGAHVFVGRDILRGYGNGRWGATQHLAAMRVLGGKDVEWQMVVGLTCGKMESRRPRKWVGGERSLYDTRLICTLNPVVTRWRKMT